MIKSKFLTLIFLILIMSVSVSAEIFTLEMDIIKTDNATLTLQDQFNRTRYVINLSHNYDEDDIFEFTYYTDDFDELKDLKKYGNVTLTGFTCPSCICNNTCSECPACEVNQTCEAQDLTPISTAIVNSKEKPIDYRVYILLASAIIAGVLIYARKKDNKPSPTTNKKSRDFSIDGDFMPTPRIPNTISQEEALRRQQEQLNLKQQQLNQYEMQMKKILGNAQQEEEAKKKQYDAIFEELNDIVRREK